MDVGLLGLLGRLERVIPGGAGRGVTASVARKSTAPAHNLCPQGGVRESVAPDHTPTRHGARARVHRARAKASRCRRQPAVPLGGPQLDGGGAASCPYSSPSPCRTHQSKTPSPNPLPPGKLQLDVALLVADGEARLDGGQALEVPGGTDHQIIRSRDQEGRDQRGHVARSQVRAFGARPYLARCHQQPRRGIRRWRPPTTIAGRRKPPLPVLCAGPAHMNARAVADPRCSPPPAASARGPDFARVSRLAPCAPATLPPALQRGHP